MTDEITEDYPPKTPDVPEGLPEVSNPDPNQTVVDVAYEVIAGQWSRGNMRKQRLRDAGFDPDEVEREVDKIFNPGN